MIATCPACGKRYRLPDDAVPAGGRNVRCAACGHGWTTLPDGTAAPLAAPLGAIPPAAPVGTGPAIGGISAIAPGAAVADRAGPAVTRDVPAPEAPAPLLTAPLSAAPVSSAAWAVDDAPPPPRRWGWLIAVLLLIVAVAALAVVEFAPADTFTPPRLGLPPPAEIVADLPPLDLTRIPLVGDRLDRLVNPPPAPVSPLRIAAHGERRMLTNGTRLLTVAGTVTNPTAAPVALAGIDAALVDPAGGALRWRIPAPVSVVGARQSATFESVAANYPAGATVLQLTPR